MIQTTSDPPSFAELAYPEFPFESELKGDR